MVLQGDAIELALVDVGHLVVLPPHCTRGGGIKDVAEPIGIVHLLDLNLLGVAVPASIILPRFPRDTLIEKVLSIFKAGVAIPKALGSYLKQNNY